MNFDGKLTVSVALLACLPLAVFAQPGPYSGRGGPGGPGPHGYSAGPGPSMGNPFMGAPNGMHGPVVPSRSPMPPSGAMPPSMNSHGPYPSSPAAPLGGIPSSRFGPVPNRAEIPMRPEMPSPMPGAHGPGAIPQGVPAPADISRMQQALRQRDYATIGKETEGIRDRTERMQRLEPDLPVQDRIQIPLINHMYRQGADLMEEGRSTRDDAKIRMGIQQIDQANEKLDRLKGKSSSDRGRGHSGGRR